MAGIRVMTAKQQLFVHEYLLSRNATESARKAGYKHPDIRAAELRDPAKNPLVARAIDEGLAKVNEQTVLDALGVQRYIHTAMTFQPLKFFTPSEGGWLLTEEQFRTLPDHIGQLVEDMTVKETLRANDDGTEERVLQYWVKFVSKTKAMDLAAKHQLGERHLSEKKITIDWAGLAAPPRADDAVEAEILRVEQAALPPAAGDAASTGNP